MKVKITDDTVVLILPDCYKCGSPDTTCIRDYNHINLIRKETKCNMCGTICYSWGKK